MRSSHGSAAGKRIGIIGCVRGRPRVSARSADIRFYTAATIDSSGTAAAKGSNRIGAGVKRPGRVRCLIERWGICYCGTSRSGITRRDHYHNASSGLSFNGSLQCVNRTSFRRRTAPGVNGDIGCLGRVALSAAYWVRRQKKFHALDVSGRCAVTLVHVTAANPLCARRHSDLVASAVVADRCACGVGAVEVIVARLWRIVAARIADAVMDGVMPIVIVIGGYAVPAAIVRFKRIVCPTLASIGARHHDILSVESERPHIRRMRVNDSRLNRRRSLRVRRSAIRRER